MMLIYDKDEQYINQVLKKLDCVYHEVYYIQMVIAWAILSCFVESQEIIFAYLTENNLDDFTYNKSLQTIIESSKASSQMKHSIHELKRKKIIV